MEWYWIVCIVVGAVLLAATVIALFMFRYAFCANRKLIAKMFQQREQDPSPLARMRFQTKAYMDALPYDALTLTAKER